jgi:hypothetical protein
VCPPTIFRGRAAFELTMTRSATDIMQDILNAAVVDAIVALKDASRDVPNVLLRDVNAIHANTAFGDLPEVVRLAVATSVRDAFARLRKDGYVVAEAKSLEPPPTRPESRSPRGRPSNGSRTPVRSPSSGGRPNSGR